MSSQSNDQEELDDETRSEINEVLSTDRPVLLAAERLLGLSVDVVTATSQRFHAQEGLDRELVYRCILVRTQETFRSLLELVDAGVGQHARVLLRPLVEDYIFLGWLSSLTRETADQYVRARAVKDIAKGAEAQKSFLPKAYASLGVDSIPEDASGLKVPDLRTVAKNADQVLTSLGASLNWKTPGPSVRQMAEAAGRLEEYDFFYLAASRSVHASLHEMSRMVWGDPASMEMSIASETLSGYHSLFALAYGTWMYDEIMADLAYHIEELETIVRSTRWTVLFALALVGMARHGRLPPIVTEEELRWTWPSGGAARESEE